MTWISVEERLPDVYQEVLFFAINAQGNKEIMTGHRDSSKWNHCCMYYSTMGLSELNKVTHWMELPDYPK